VPTTVKFVYQYPEHGGREGDMLDAGPIGDVAAAAEAAGWGAIAFSEHPAPSARWLDSGGHQTLDPFVALGFAAAATSRLRLLTYLAIASYRSPLVLAKAAATLDKLSGGRLVLGVGAGYQRSEFRALGLDFDHRGAALDEVLDVLPHHWAGEPFAYDGRTVAARDVIALPRPVQDPIPMWVGGNAPATLRRVAERAQGWLPLLGPPALYRTTRTTPIASHDELVARIATLRDLAGDRPIDVAVPYVDLTIGDPGADVERHRDAFGRLQDAGATWLTIIGTTHEASATLEFLAAFGQTFAG
jgi:probable F420-dependent oxidoreductase